MLRTLGRIASLLLVTGMVAGGLYYLVNANLGRGSQQAGDRRDRRAGESAREAAASSGNPGGQSAAAPGAVAGEPNASSDAAARPEARARDGRGRRGWGRELSLGEDADHDGVGRSGEGGAWRGESRARREGREGREDRDGHGGHGEFSPGRGAAGLLMTTLQVALGAALVVGLQRFFQRKRQGQPA